MRNQKTVPVFPSVFAPDGLRNRLHTAENWNHAFLRSSSLRGTGITRFCAAAACGRLESRDSAQPQPAANWNHAILPPFLTKENRKQAILPSPLTKLNRNQAILLRCRLQRTGITRFYLAAGCSEVESGDSCQA
jgi:hypothetical protein